MIETLKGGLNKIFRSQVIWGMLTSGIFLVLVIVLAFTHLEETKKLLFLLAHSDAGWMIIAILIQIPTYIFTGIVWHLVGKSANYHLTLRSLSELAVEQLSINQIIPGGGIAGNLMIVRAMKRLGLPTPLAMEIFFIETLSFHISFAAVTLISVIILWWQHNITPIITSLTSMYFVVEVVIVLLVWAAVNHHRLDLPLWLKKRKLIARILSAIENVSQERVFSLRLLIETSLFRIGVFVLDALSLFAIMIALGIESNFTISFLALVIASVAGVVTLLPGGIGGFEAGLIGMLVIFQIPLEAAIATTAIFRALTLWIPLVPGIILAREDLWFRKDA